MTLVIVVLLAHVAAAAYLYSRGHKIAAAIVLAAGIIELFLGFNKYH